MAGRKKGTPKTGGRRPGSHNKVTRDLRELAQPYGPDAVMTLARIMSESDNETAKIAAAKELLDRGYGKAKQYIEATGKDGKDLISSPGAGVDWLGYPIAKPGEGDKPV